MNSEKHSSLLQIKVLGPVKVFRVGKVTVKLADGSDQLQSGGLLDMIQGYFSSLMIERLECFIGS
jgi:hypothetical protein